MSTRMRKRHDAAFKAKVALETIKEEHTLAQLPTVFSEKKAAEQTREEKEDGREERFTTTPPQPLYTHLNQLLFFS